METLSFLTTYGPALSAVGVAVAFVWSVFQFFSVRAREEHAREFKTFHRLIKELVEPPSEGASLYIDRQCAVLYELRFFPRYYPFTRRTLQSLKNKWSLDGRSFPRILEELEITLKIIDSRMSSLPFRIRRFFGISHALEE